MSPQKIITYSLAVALFLVIVLSKIEKEDAKIAQVPLADKIHAAIVEKGRFSPKEVEVYEVPSDYSGQPIYLAYKPKTLKEIRYVGEDGESFFPDFRNQGTAPVIKMRISIDGQDDKTLEQKIGEPVPDFRNDGYTELWLSHKRYSGRVFVVIERPRAWKLFSGYGG